MNNPFDNQPEAPVVNLMQPASASVPEPTPVAISESVQEMISNIASAPLVSGGGTSKKKWLIILGLVVVLGASALVFLSSDDSSLPQNVEAPLAAPISAVAPVPVAPVPVAPVPVAPVPVAPVPVAPVAPTGALQDAVPPVAPVGPCEQRMIDYATQNGADPKAYVEQNQAYLVECNKALQAGAN